MKRTADECPEPQRGAKRIRTSSDSSVESSLTGNGSQLAKDGIVEEIRVTNFMSFTSHKFRLAL